MKLLFVLAAVCALAAVAMCEECRGDDGCTHVSCPEADYVRECVSRQCTCTHVKATCMNASDCQGGDDSCRFTWHCYDNKCRCGFGFGGSGK